MVLLPPPPLPLLLLAVELMSQGVEGATRDWLVTPLSTPAAASRSADGCTVTLANGLLSRTFAVPGKGCPAPNWVTTDLADTTDDEMPPKSALAALDVEASVELAFDGLQQRWDVGGLNQSCSRWLRSQPHTTQEAIFSTCAYLNRSQPSYSRPRGNASAFQYFNHTIKPATAPFNYTPARHAANTPWPPAGVHLAVRFVAPSTAPAALRAVAITVHYELYQGVPAHSKWVTVSAPSLDSDAAKVVVANVFVEQLRVNDDYAGSSYPIADAWVTGAGAAENAYESTTHSVLSARQPPLLLLRTDTYHGTGCTWGSRSESTYADNAFVQCSYTSQALRQPSCIPGAHPANICPGSGVRCPECGKSTCPCPAESLPAGAYVSLSDADKDYFGSSSISNDDGVLTYVSFRTTLLLFDTTEHERRGLTFRRLTKLTQPWVTENPLFFHLSNTSSAGIHQAVDDAVEVGIEMVVQSFGTSWKMEDSDNTYLAAMKQEIDYAHSRGIEIGGYDLIDLDRGGLGYDKQAISPDGKVGGSACFASKWLDYLDPLIEQKIVDTGLDMVETDGPYGGGLCGATNHSHHHGLLDSVYWQTRLQAEFYQKMRRLGVFVNAPDVYFQQGSNKMMFYADPTNYGKPRKMDLLLSRQMLFDSTYEWIATQGWSFLPLDSYAGGGAEAQFRPLEENVDDYDLAWAMYMGYGVAGVCWRGPAIFEGHLSKAVVTKWIAFYKQYRETLTSEMLIHVRRPDGQNLDAVLHANPDPGATERGLLFAFNPTDTQIVANVSVDLYYTGLEKSATVVPQGASEGASAAVADITAAKVYQLRRDYTIVLEMSIGPSSYAWWTVH